MCLFQLFGRSRASWQVFEKHFLMLKSRFEYAVTHH